MRGWSRWIGCGAALSAALFVGSYALGDTAAQFPGALFSFVPRSDLIRAGDHNALGREVEATEHALGANLANIATRYAPTILVEQPTSGETFPTVWTAPQAGRIVRVSCDTSGVSSQVPIDLVVNDGTPASAGAVMTCTPTSAAIVPTDGAMAEGDRLQLSLGTIVGSASRVSVSVFFQPGA